MSYSYTPAQAAIIADNPAGVSNSGNATDSDSNVRVDFVWGNQPMQPNDYRTEEAAVNIGGTTGSNQLAFQTAVVTAASGNGTTVTYTSANPFNVGQTVTITGLATAALNLTSVRIATLVGAEGARTGFTVTNAASGTDTAQTAVAKVVIGSIPGVGADAQWGVTTAVTGDRLNAALDNHANVEAAWSGYPTYLQGDANYMITAASGNGTTVTYTSQNELAAGDVVNITGLTSYNLSAATVASANVLRFTVTNATNAGEITGQRGKVESTTALSAYDGAGLGFINVPSILGRTTALALDALKDAGYEAANITTAAAAANAVSTISAVARTAAVATITSTGAGAKYPVGTKITVASLAAPDTALNGTFTVTAVAADTVSYTTTTSGTLSTGSLSVAGLSGVAGTIKTQSTAAGTASVATTATITITPHATVS